MSLKGHWKYWKQSLKPLKKYKIKSYSIYTRACKCGGPRSVSRGQACCVVCWSPSEELLHAVKQTVVSVWPFQWGTFSPLQNRPRNKTSIWKPSGRNELTNATTMPPSALRPQGLPPTHARPCGATTITTQRHPRMCCTHTERTKINTANGTDGMHPACLNYAEKFYFSFVGMFLLSAAAQTVRRFLKRSPSKCWHDVWKTRKRVSAWWKSGEAHK